MYVRRLLKHGVYSEMTGPVSDSGPRASALRAAGHAPRRVTYTRCPGFPVQLIPPARQARVDQPFVAVLSEHLRTAAAAQQGALLPQEQNGSHRANANANATVLPRRTGRWVGLRLACSRSLASLLRVDSEICQRSSCLVLLRSDSSVSRPLEKT